MKKLGKKATPKGDINITPLIDILLVLLVIFMTITPLTPKGLDANVPQPPPPGQPQEPDEKTVIVSLDSAGVLKINSQVYQKAELEAALKEIFRTRSERVMFINASPELLYNEVVEIIDIAKGAGVDKIGLMTAQLGGEVVN